jgi:glycerol transport system substrate-binding protein
MKLGYQDCGSWTLFKSTPVDRARPPGSMRSSLPRKTVDVKKSHVGLTVIRDSTIRHKSSPSVRRSSAAWSSSIARPTACVDADRHQRPGLPKLASNLVAADWDVSSALHTATSDGRLAAGVDQDMARMQAAARRRKPITAADHVSILRRLRVNGLADSMGRPPRSTNEKAPGETIAYDDADQGLGPPISRHCGYQKGGALCAATFSLETTSSVRAF